MAPGAELRGAGFQEFAHLVDGDEIIGRDGRDHDAAARLLDRESLRHQAEHGLTHRTARHIEPARKLGHAQRLAGT